MQKTYNILSYGESLSHYKKEDHSPAEEIAFGVNDVGRYTEVDYLLLVDHPAHFSPERIEAIKKTLPYNYFVVELAWLKLLKNCVPISLALNRSNLSTLRCGIHTLSYSELPYSYNSPFIAACLAYRMGAQRINLFGIDFNTDSAVGFDFHPKNIRDFKNLYAELRKIGIKMYTTPESRLAAFIPINPDLKTIKINEYA